MIASPRINIALALTFVFILVFLVFRPCLDNGFVNWDDDVHLLQNPFVQTLDAKHIREIFTSTVNKIYIPLTSLSFAVEHHFFGKQPFIYHLDNLILHMAVTALGLLLARRCGLSLTASVLAALIFGLHPMHVESVAWVTERKDVLYAFFYLLALLSYGSYVQGGKKRCFILAVIWGFLSALAKPMALSLPLIFLLFDWYWQRRVTLIVCLEKILLAALIFPVIWVTYQLQMRLVEIHFPKSFLIWIWSFTFHIQKFFYPDDFVLLYQLPKPVALFNPVYVFSLALFLLLIIGWWVFRRVRLLTLSLGFYFCSIFFLLRWDQVADVNIVADRFMYLPSLGFCMLIATGLEKIWQKTSQSSRRGKVLSQGLLVSLVICILGLLAFKTNQQILVWRDEVALWSHQLRRQPGAATALVYNKLAEAKELQDAEIRKDVNKLQEVIGLYHMAIEIKSDYADAYYNLGKLYTRLDRVDLAEFHLERAIEFDSAHFEAYFLLGRIYQQLDRPREAIGAFQQAMMVNPDNRELRQRIIQAYQEFIRAGQAVAFYEREKERLLLEEGDIRQ